MHGSTSTQNTLPLKVLFRVDASPTIGTGHVMRCLTLADTLRERGATCSFISRHLPAYLQDIIISKDHQSFVIEPNDATESHDTLPHAHFLGTSQIQDAEQSRMLLESIEPDWLVIDHYGIDHHWESRLRSLTKQILVIDDLADRKHDCDLLVDQNLYADMGTRYKERIPAKTKALLGATYAILRPEFKDARSHAKVRHGSPRRIFIFFGGMDSANYTLPVVKALANLKRPEMRIDVVIGAGHPTREQIESICCAHGYHCHVQTKKMGELLLQADVAIGAGGSTSWERACLGLPSLAYIVAPNQEALTLHAAHLGLLKAGLADIHNADALSAEIQDFLDADEAREQMSQACLNTIDTAGAQRIVDEMLKPRLHLRPASHADSKRLYEWRNHPSIREISTNSEPIPWESHEKWFNHVLKDVDRALYVAEERDTAVGVIRFDIDNQQAEVSLYLAPDQKGKGLGTQLLRTGEDVVTKERPDLTSFVAIVLEGNEASHHLFKRCGYIGDGSRYIKKIKA